MPFAPPSIVVITHALYVMVEPVNRWLARLILEARLVEVGTGFRLLVVGIRIAGRESPGRR